MHQRKIAGKGLPVLALALVTSLVLTVFYACSGGSGSSDTSDGDSGTAAVASIEIVQEPDKTVYEEGEKFDPTGMVVDALLEDGTTESDVSFSYTKRALETTDTSVTITYGDAKAYQEVTVTYLGNNEQYSVANTPALDGSPLEGKTYMFLGSSVTYGYGSGGEAISDYLVKRNGCTAVKEAVGGTTLADIENSDGKANYVQRLETYIESEDREEYLDAFVCQVSTNDMYDSDNFGVVTDDDVTDIDAFDRTTTFGAMEYIVTRVSEVWDCPFVFFTNNNMGNANYEAMVDAALQIEAKYDSVTVLDLYHDEEFNDITSEEKSLYMMDYVHPTKAGYREWWLPEFEELLTELAA